MTPAEAFAAVIGRAGRELAISPPAAEAVPFRAMVSYTHGERATALTARAGGVIVTAAAAPLLALGLPVGREVPAGWLVTLDGAARPVRRTWYADQARATVKLDLGPAVS